MIGYRLNLNPRYSIRGGVNFGIGTTPEEEVLGHTPLQKADFYGLFGAISEIVISSYKVIDVSDAVDDLNELNNNL